MRSRVVIRPGAARDISEAYRWYGARNRAIAIAFLDAIETGLDRIAESPQSYPVVHRDVRRVLLGRFPYALSFRLVGEHWRVVACTHLRRDARRWRSRR